ncbi:hypothetical protein VTL71DRAFT_10426 [Oculimacula yallundae]|uniref:Uncharacterized protein n=1 Tax=Oculimacula yallundae TaxID=86028 RepID=A0ABR4CTH9_9HELO
MAASTPLMVHIFMYLPDSDTQSSESTGFIKPGPTTHGLKDSLTTLFTTNQFNISALQPRPLKNLDLERTTFQVCWNITSSMVPKSEVLDGDVKELMRIMEDRG